MKIDLILFETHLSTLIEHRNPEMSWSICRQRKWPHAQTGDRVGDHFKSDNDEDKLTYHAVVQAGKFVILVTILVLGDDSGGLAERKTNRVAQAKNKVSSWSWQDMTHLLESWTISWHLPQWSA